MHQIFFVKELVVIITEELINCSYCEWDAVSLALTCRALESPALSVLWATRTTLSTLIQVLPQDTLGYTLPQEDPAEFAETFRTEVLDIVKDPPRESWDRLRRYGSWMRELRMDEHQPEETIPWHNRELIIGNTVFTQLSLAFPTELVCSGLQKLKWFSSYDRLPSLRHFLSPTLAEIEIITTPPDDPIQTPLPTTPVLPGLYLRSLQLTFHPDDDEAFGNSTSSTILQCGPFLQRLETSAQLSNAAVSHLLGLRHLRTLRIRSDPPPDPVSSSDNIFPSLETLILDGGVGHKWLSFLGAAQENGSADGDSRSLEVGLRATLMKLYCLGGTTITSDFIASLCTFQKLTHLFVDGSCSTENGCTFLLTDEDITQLANALPDIKSLQLGTPCSANRCHTTAFSLFTLSTRCLKLKTLEIHFNTTRIGRDLDRLFKEAQHETMRSLPRCPLHYLAVADTPISTRDVGSVVIRLSGIFHGLQGFHSRHRKWVEASRQVRLLYNYRSHVMPSTCIPLDSEDEWDDDEDNMSYHPGPQEVPRLLGRVRGEIGYGSEW